MAVLAIGLWAGLAGFAAADEGEKPPAASDEGGKPPPWWNQSPPPQAPRPSYTALGFDEDWSFLRDPRLRSDYLDRVKYFGLGRPGWYLTLGSFIRPRYELAPGFPLDTPHDPHGYFLQRYLAQGDLHLSRFVRVFVQLKSALENGRAGGPLPIDVDQLDLAQGFVELSLPISRLKLTLRGGRQELSYGSQRLLDIREGPNNPQSFDGVVVRLIGAELRIDMLTMRTVADRFGVFDDGDVPGQWLWGVYGSFGPVLGGLHIDTYYLGFRRLDARYAKGSGDELRHTVGLRLFGQWRRLEYDCELMVQFGSFAGRAIGAWDLSVLVRRPFALGPLQLVTVLAGDMASGDQSSRPRRLGTFSTPFARGSYFTEAGYFLYANTTNLHPGVELHLPRSVALTVDVALFQLGIAHTAEGSDLLIRAALIAAVAVADGVLAFLLRQRHAGRSVNLLVGQAVALLAMATLLALLPNVVTLVWALLATILLVLSARENEADWLGFGLALWRRRWCAASPAPSSPTSSSRSSSWVVPWRCSHRGR